MSKQILTSGESNTYKYKEVFLGFSVQVKLSTVGSFFWTQFLIIVTLGKWYASSAGSLLRFFPNGYPLPEMELHLLLWATRSGVTALSSGHLFYELRLLVEFSEISFALIHVCYLGNILVFSKGNPGLLLI